MQTPLQEKEYIPYPKTAFSLALSLLLSMFCGFCFNQQLVSRSELRVSVAQAVCLHAHHIQDCSPVLNNANAQLNAFPSLTIQPIGSKMNNDLIISFATAARAASKAQTSAEVLKHVDECYRLRDHSPLDEFEYLCDHVIDSLMERARDLEKNETPTN